MLRRIQRGIRTQLRHGGWPGGGVIDGVCIVKRIGGRSLEDEGEKGRQLALSTSFLFQESRLGPVSDCGVLVGPETLPKEV